MQTRQLFFLFSCSFLLFHQAFSYIDEDGMPQEGSFGYRGFLKSTGWFLTGNWNREARMLKAFDEADYKTFEELFVPEDAGRHPWMVREAVEKSQIILLHIMVSKGLNIKGIDQRHIKQLETQQREPIEPTIHKASQNNDYDIVDLLVEQDFELNEKDYRKRTVLHKAAECMDTQAPSELIKRGVLIKPRDNNSKTAGDIARENLHWCEEATSSRSPQEIRYGREQCERAQAFLSALQRAWEEKQQTVLERQIIKKIQELKQTEYDEEERVRELEQQLAHIQKERAEAEKEIAELQDLIQ